MMAFLMVEGNERVPGDGGQVKGVQHQLVEKTASVLRKKNNTFLECPGLYLEPRIRQS